MNIFFLKIYISKTCNSKNNLLSLCYNYLNIKKLINNIYYKF